MSTSFHHPFRIDAPTLTRAMAASGRGLLLNNVQLPDNVRFLSVNPAVFTHAYILLGEQPQRFLSDLTLYLTSVRTFFERTNTAGGISIPAAANPDSRRRLSEDLGVALAAYFMVEVFGLGWDSISQIPQNSKLSKKRPDFQGYTSTNQRYLFEAKGTTKLPAVEKAMSKAITQVKGYPEPAEAKIAIVSYLSGDERYFPSTSFVVDPPMLPEEVKPTPEISGLLHFEKVLQFAGLPQTAKEYLSTLSHRLREEYRIKEGGKVSYTRERRIKELEGELRESFAEESQPHAPQSIRIRDTNYLGKSLPHENSSLTAFFGVDRDVLNAGVSFQANSLRQEARLDVSENEVTSIFPDGTMFRLTGLNAASV